MFDPFCKAYHWFLRFGRINRAFGGYSHAEGASGRLSLQATELFPGSASFCVLNHCVALKLKFRCNLPA